MRPFSQPSSCLLVCARQRHMNARKRFRFCQDKRCLSITRPMLMRTHAIQLIVLRDDDTRTERQWTRLNLKKHSVVRNPGTIGDVMLRVSTNANQALARPHASRSGEVQASLQTRLQNRHSLATSDYYHNFILQLAVVFQKQWKISVHSPWPQH
jgi:hypothetical protein